MQLFNLNIIELSISMHLSRNSLLLAGSNFCFIFYFRCYDERNHAASAIFREAAAQVRALGSMKEE